MNSFQSRKSDTQKIYEAGEGPNLTRTSVVDGLRIGEWAQNQRYANRNGKLSIERIAKLEGIDFIFEPLLSEWERNFAILKRLHDAGTDINLPSSAIVDGVAIGRWINSHRYKLYARGKLSAERIVLLESIGMKWTLRN